VAGGIVQIVVGVAGIVFAFLPGGHSIRPSCVGHGRTRNRCPNGWAGPFSLLWALGSYCRGSRTCGITNCFQSGGWPRLLTILGGPSLSAVCVERVNAVLLFRPALPSPTVKRGAAALVVFKGAGFDVSASAWLIPSNRSENLGARLRQESSGFRLSTFDCQLFSTVNTPRCCGIFPPE
jgi:hypothetical protein